MPVYQALVNYFSALEKNPFQFIPERDWLGDSTDPNFKALALTLNAKLAHLIANALGTRKQTTERDL
jgi:hypothetical protein